MRAVQSNPLLFFLHVGQGILTSQSDSTNSIPTLCDGGSYPSKDSLLAAISHSTESSIKIHMYDQGKFCRGKLHSELIWPFLGCPKIIPSTKEENAFPWNLNS